MSENTIGNGQSNFLHNTGGPASRTRSMSITCSFTESQNVTEESASVAFWIPRHIMIPEDWVLELCNKIGFKSLEEAEQKLTLPSERMLISKSEKTRKCPSLNNTDWVRNAIILARCNDTVYLPGSPLIFTRKRLERSIHLIKINIKNYYELD